MKAAVILGDGIWQICLQPETEAEKAILKLFEADQNIQVATKQGTIYDTGIPSYVVGAMVHMSKAGYARAFEERDALMLILTPKTSQDNNGS